MKDLVIGDIHFGIKTNSVSWLTQQLRFVNEEIIPRIDDHDRVIFLGDLFDVRYSTNTQVGCEVKKLIRDMVSSHKNIDFYIIAGNHDYYSPIVDFEKYNVYELLFGEEFVNAHKNLHIVSLLPLLDNRTLMLPWYFSEDETRYETVMKEYKGKFDIIYCHTDCEHWSADKASLKGDAVVYSGHIHYPYVNEELKLYNIGAACAFTFNDVNSQRYIYTIDDGRIVASYENNVTPKFHRYYNERIFTLNGSDLENAYTQLYISKDNINKAKYIEQIKNIKTTYTDCSIKTVIVDESVQDIINGVSLNANIQDYIKHNMPEHLKGKYELLNKKLNS